jgi:hypothetical protein
VGPSPTLKYGVLKINIHVILKKMKFLQFCKNLFKVRNSTPNFMVYGELGRVPLEISIKLKME